MAWLGFVFAVGFMFLNLGCWLVLGALLIWFWCYLCLFVFREVCASGF